MDSRMSNTFNVALKIERSFQQQINFLITIWKNYLNHIYKNANLKQL